MIKRRAVSEDERAHAAPQAIVVDESHNIVIAGPSRSLSPEASLEAKKRAHFRSASGGPPMTTSPPQRRPTVLRSFTAPLPTPPTKQHRSSSDEARAALGVDMPRLLLYNYFLRRIDNIQILSPNSVFAGKPEDFELLRLLASTHNDTRWWTVYVDDLACPQCVEELGRRKEDRNGYLARKERKKWARVVLRPRCWGWVIRKGGMRMHCGGGECRVFCEHRELDVNNVRCSLVSWGRTIYPYW